MSPVQATSPVPTIRHPITVGGPEFTADPHGHYAWLRAHAPVYRGRVAYLTDRDVWLVSRAEDCRAVLADPRFPRAPQDGGSAMVAELPEHVRLITSESMIMKDGGEHRRLRKLVVKPFSVRAIERLGDRVRELASDLLDGLEPQGRIELREQFALPIPLTVISEMVGVEAADRERFHRGTRALVDGMAEMGQQAWTDEVTAMIDLVRGLIDRRRERPGDDILTGLIEAEEDGDRLDDDELVSMVFTLITAGYETTYHLITNAVVTLLDHPDQLELLLAQPELMPSAVEEVLRYAGPVHGTEPLTAAEDVTWHGETIPAGAMVEPLIASANRDPDAFADPDTFDITRTPNDHLEFGSGVHLCLGANLARLETRVALGVLFARNPRLRLAVDQSELELEPLPLWTRYRGVPVVLG
jgi:cytochrome P450